MELINIHINWETNPHVAYLNVHGTAILTPQVRLLEEFVAKETGQRFTLIFQVRKIAEIKQVNNEQSPTATE